MYQLVAEVLDHAPIGLTPAEVLLLVALAEETRVIGEVREIGTADLCRRARIEPRGLRHAIARLADRGIKVRVAIGTDKLGRPLYAVPGRLPRWTLPPLAAPSDCPCRTCASPLQPPVDNPQQGGRPSPPEHKTPGQEGGVQSPPSNQGGRPGPPAGRPSPPAGRPSPPSPSRDVTVLDQGRPTLTYVTALTGATDDEGRQMLKTLTQRHRPRSIGAYVRSIPSGDLKELLTELRDSNAPTTAAIPTQCGKCGPGRLIETATGDVARCPNCHPRARRTA